MFQVRYYSSDNYISMLLTANSLVVVDGEFLLEWCEYFGQLHSVALLEPLI